MKKTILMLAFTLGILSVNAQMFYDVPVSGHLTTVIKKFSDKGFTYKKKYEDNIVILTGTYMGSPVELFIFSTPKTKQVHTYVVYLRKHTKWSDMLAEYVMISRTLTNKYGNPTAELETFLDPYEDGDGYEMQAVQLNKCRYLKSWIGVHKNNLMVSISEYMQIKIHYENPINFELNLNELDQLNTRVF